MMLKDILGTLWQDDKKKEAPVAKPAPTIPSSPGAAPSAPMTPVLDVEHITQSIDGLIKDNPAYTALSSFLTTVESIAPLIADEALRFKTAQATTKVPVPELLTAAASFREVIGNEVNKFNEKYVGATEHEIGTISAQVPVLEQQIIELTTKLGELSQKKAEVAASVIAKTSDLEKAKIDFKSIVTTLDARYSEVEKKVSQYLGA